MSIRHTHLDSFRDRRTIIPSEMPVDEIIQGIYCGFDTRSGEPLYVGLSENIRNRIYQHIQQLNRRSKTKAHWDEDFKVDSSLVDWKLLEVVGDRAQLNARELHWWEALNHPRLNITDISAKHFRTGGDTRKKHPGMEVLLRMRADEMTVREIASELGVTKNAVYGWFSAAEQPFNDSAEKKIAEGLPKRTDDFLADESNFEKLKAEIAAGESFLAVSNRYGLDRKTMQSALEESGSLGKRTRAYKAQLEDRFPKEAISKALSQIELHAQDVWSELGISSDEASTLMRQYDLSHLLGPWSKR